MKLNCDLGESFGAWSMGHDELVMPWIDQANIACGFHASDPLVMANTVYLAKKHGTTIGAHPGYPDLVGFGRRSMACSSDELQALMLYQIGALEQIALANGCSVSYVKPHGALYNDMMVNDRVLFDVMQSIAKCHNVNALMLLATNENQRYGEMADKLGISLIFEAFADRRYLDSGRLMPRSDEGAVLHRREDILDQVRFLCSQNQVVSDTGNKLQIQADSICVHGDNQDSVSLIQDIRKVVDESNR